jgi:hypothetical protein|tara:strand:+ start:684 stop:1109 length:426 start_codon:yes stop_codon:yes gene_type:complete
MDDKNWIPLYRKNSEAIWIRGVLTNGEEFNYDEYSSWTELKDYCDKEHLFFKELYIQFKSHQIELHTEGVEGIYIIRSIKGSLGKNNNQHFYTVGTLKGSKVFKQMYLTPELVVEKEYEDDIENCFEEAIIYDKTRKKSKK